MQLAAPVVPPLPAEVPALVAEVPPLPAMVPAEVPPLPPPLVVLPLPSVPAVDVPMDPAEDAPEPDPAPTAAPPVEPPLSPPAVEEEVLLVDEEVEGLADVPVVEPVAPMLVLLPELESDDDVEESETVPVLLPELEPDDEVEVEAVAAVLPEPELETEEEEVPEEPASELDVVPLELEEPLERVVVEPEVVEGPEDPVAPTPDALEVLPEEPAGVSLPQAPRTSAAAKARVRVRILPPVCRAGSRARLQSQPPAHGETRKDLCTSSKHGPNRDSAVQWDLRGDPAGASADELPGRDGGAMRRWSSPSSTQRLTLPRWEPPLTQRQWSILCSRTPQRPCSKCAGAGDARRSGPGAIPACAVSRPRGLSPTNRRTRSVRRNRAKSIAGMTAAELEHLFRTYGPLIHERCRRILGDGAAADDATQETFVRVHRHLAQAPSAAEAVPWIYRIATNYCLNELRDRSKRAEPMGELPELSDALTETRLADVQLARALIDRVPAKLRACAYLTYVDGLTQDEVARVLGISRRSVVNHLADFLDRARKFVARSEP